MAARKLITFEGMTIEEAAELAGVDVDRLKSSPVAHRALFAGLQVF